MLKVFIALIAVIASFFAGMAYQRSHSQERKQFTEQIRMLNQEVAGLENKNSQLQDTLGLVKRQIQTDRIAYQSLQETVASSQGTRDELQEKLEQQQALLNKLRQRLGDSTGD